MVNRVTFLLALLAVAAFSSVASATSTYAVDTGNLNMGLADNTVEDDIFLNGFTAIPGANLIGDIKVAIGWPGFNGNLNGHALTLAVWSDPNQDGNPSDATVLTSFTSTFTNVNATAPTLTPGWNTFTLPTPVAVTGKFFVGYMMSVSADDLAANTGGQIGVVDSDTTSPQGQSWLGFAAYGAGDLNNLPGAGIANMDTYFPSFPLENFMIEAGAVPEPITMSLIGMGIIGLGGYIRRRVKVAE